MRTNGCRTAAAASLLTGVVALFCAPVRAAELTEVVPVTDRVLLLRFDDLVSVKRESLGGNGRDGRVVTAPLDLSRAARPESYRVTAAKGDPEYAGAGRAPERVGRKSKGHDFTNDASAPGGVAWATAHDVYLVLPRPLRPGASYTVTVGDLSSGKRSLPLAFDPAKSRSEAVHVNAVGYAPAAPQKFAYVSQWMGDLGPLDLAAVAGRPFRVLDAKTGRVALAGKVALRKRAAEPDGGQAEDGPNANFNGADLYECDFSALRAPGTYVVSVDGVGCSYPFPVGADVYRTAYRTVARALYHQRCGVALDAKHTQWTRDACHVPDAAHPLNQTDHRHLDGGFGDGPKGATFGLTGETRAVQGGWHDAGDWDRESWHLEAADTLLLAYELNPRHFADGELNVPESGNGVPDLVDEARWCIDYYRRLQRPDGGVSVGMFEESFPRMGWRSDTDPMKRYLYAEDPAQSYRYAAAACRLAWCLTLAGKPDLAPAYVESAERAWAWAGKNLKDGDEPKLRDDRFHAAAALYRATGKAAYHDAFKADCQIATEETPLSAWQKPDQRWGAWTYVLTDRPDVDRALKDRLTRAAVRYARTVYAETAAKRGTRMGYDWYVPRFWGAATIPHTLALAVARRLEPGDPELLAAQYTTCDAVLGANALNTTWATGLGARSPRSVMHWDSYYRPEPVPGIVPFGPTRYAGPNAPGPWDPAFAQKTAYPDAKLWPPDELWFETRLCPSTSEFTVGSLAEAAAAFGALCADAPAGRAR
jgi:endoglucanase